MRYPSFLSAFLCLSFWAGLIFCSHAPILAAAPAPSRVVSLDYCADQYLLALANRDQILALSPDATSDYSFAAEQAEGLPQRRSDAEWLAFAQPDLVLRQWGGSYDLAEKLAPFAIPVVTLGDDQAIPNQLAQIHQIGQLLGQEARANQLIAMISQQLEQVKKQATPIAAHQIKALYLTPGGATGAADSPIDWILQQAGLINQAALAPPGQPRPSGWRALDLEMIAATPPDWLITGFFDLSALAVDHWSFGRHDLLTRLRRERPSITLPARFLACSNWHLLDAVTLIQQQIMQQHPINPQHSPPP